MNPIEHGAKSAQHPELCIPNAQFQGALNHGRDTLACLQAMINSACANIAVIDDESDPQQELQSCHQLIDTLVVRADEIRDNVQTLLDYLEAWAGQQPAETPEAQPQSPAAGALTAAKAHLQQLNGDFDLFLINRHDVTPVDYSLVIEQAEHFIHAVQACKKQLQTPAPAIPAHDPATEAHAANRRVVKIPSREQHEGYHAVTVWLDWHCPKCGGPRGEPFQTRSYDGSLQLYCDGWTNPCGHVDKYSSVRDEAASNGLNVHLHNREGM